MKQVPRVLACIGKEDGPAAWRVFQPFAELQRRQYPCEWTFNDDARTPDLMLGKLYQAVGVRAHAPFDVVILSRLSWSGVGQQAAAERYMRLLRTVGVTPIYECDDDVFSEAVIPHLLEAGTHEGRTAEQLEQDRQARIHALRLCDGATVTTQRLATVVRQYTDAPVEVVPNALDLRWFRQVQQHAPRYVPGPTIGWAGGARPARDFAVMAEAWARVAEKRPNVTFVVIGFQPWLDGVPPERIRRLPWLGIREYPLTLAEIDIGCCPLDNNRFTRCKTPIKAWEYAASGAAVVASPTVYRDTIESGYDGFLCETADQWEDALLALLDEPTLRRRMARRQLKRVEKRHNLTLECWRWPASWLRILERAKERVA